MVFFPKTDQHLHEILYAILSGSHALEDWLRTLTYSELHLTHVATELIHLLSGEGNQHLLKAV